MFFIEERCGVLCAKAIMALPKITDEDGMPTEFGNQDFCCMLYSYSHKEPEEIGAGDFTGEDAILCQMGRGYVVQ